MEISDDKFVELFENVASIKTSNTTMFDMLLTLQKDFTDLRQLYNGIPEIVKKEVQGCQNKFHPDSNAPEEVRKDNIVKRELTAQELKYKKMLTIAGWISAISLLVGILLSLRAVT